MCEFANFGLAGHGVHIGSCVQDFRADCHAEGFARPVQAQCSVHLCSVLSLLSCLLIYFIRNAMV